MKVLLFSFLLGCCSLLVSAQQPVDYVNPFIGTSNYLRFAAENNFNFVVINNN